MAPSRPNPAGRRVLVVEDEPFIAAIFAELIHELGYEVSGFANGIASARREISKRDFDVVLLDLSLGGQYSPELADLLVEMKVPFAFVTGYSRPFEARHSHIPLLHKPFTLGQLNSVLNALMGLHTTRYRRASIKAA
jgi:CheY-like chemotaxis protein